MTTPGSVYFFPFRFESQSGRLWREDEERPLRPKSAAVLYYLATHAGQVVSKNELLVTVWPDVIVSEAVLTVCVNELRQALGDEAQQPRFIETVHRRGYRFIAPLTTPEEENQKSKGKNQKAKIESQSLTPSTQLPAPIVVGREAELGQLRQWWEQALRGQRQVVFIAGEPGVGKTTLVDTFLRGIGSWELGSGSPPPQSLHPAPHIPIPHPLIGRGQCVEQYGEGEAYLPVLEALGQLCRGPEGQRVREVLQHYAPTWLLQMPGLVEAAELNALYARTVGATRERMLREMADAMEALTSERGLLFVCEDLHASDRSTIELLTYLAQRRGPARFLVLGTYRPAQVIARAHPLRQVVQELHGRQQCQYLSLELLSHDAVGAYLAQRLVPGSASPSLAAEVYQRTEGNALFMVTVAEYLLQQELLHEENGLWQLRGNLQSIGVPESVRQLIEQQIEQLPAEEQQILEVASIAGIEFSTAAVSAGLALDTSRAEASPIEDQCEQLSRRTPFLQVSGLVEWPDGTVTMRYDFRHALYQEVVYERMSPGRRSQLHRRIGERLEVAYGPRTGEIAAELAIHFERGRDKERTVVHLQRAGENALRRYAYPEALGHFNKAAEVLQTLPQTAGRARRELALQFCLLQALVAVKGHASAEVERAYLHAQALCEQVGTTQQLFFILLGLFRLRHGHCEYQHARDLSAQCLALAQREQDPALFFPAYYALGASELLLGNFAAAEEYLMRGIRCYDARHDATYVALYGNANPYAACQGYAATALWFLGYPHQAVQGAADMLTSAKEVAAPLTLATTKIFASFVYHACRQGILVQEQAEEGIAIATRMGFPFWRALCLVWRGWGLAEQGHYEEGIEQMKQGLLLQRETGSSVHRVHFLVLLAEAHGGAGQYEAGLRLLAEAETEMERTDERFYEAELWRIKGELVLQSGVQSREFSVQTKQKSKVKTQKSKIPNPQHLTPSTQVEVAREAERCFLKAIEIACRQQAKSLELRATVSLARLWQRQGKTREAHQLLVEVYEWFTEGLDTKDLQEAKALLGSL